MKFMVYEIWGTDVNIDWSSSEERYIETAVCLDRKVLDDSSDNLCIGATGADGEYHQFDSYEGYYAADHFAAHPDWKLEIRSYQVDIPDIEKYKVQ